MKEPLSPSVMSPWMLECEFVLRLSILMSVTNPFMVLLYYRDPDAKLFITSMVTIAEYPAWVRLIAGLPTLLILFSCWVTILMAISAFVPYFYATVSFTTELK